LPIPVISYHAVNVISNRYAENDHIALAADLRQLHELGYRVISLSRLFEWHQGEVADEALARAVAITFDDGSWFDYYDLEHPTCGWQRGMLGILQDFRDEVGAASQPGLHASSFVISSPAARAELDRKGLVGRGWWGDEWWAAAERSGLMSIECHSWDHNHPDLDRVAQRDQLKGDFSAIDTLEDCEAQLARAGDYIARRLQGRRPRFFAYPWGQASAYLQKEYLPQRQERHGFLAAFNTEPRPVRRSDDRWALPRYVFGRDWRREGELEAVLAAAPVA
jgi:peptidoglycan/xylan/chitin deacetylase (PgdA/CDA1 family)